MADLRNELKEWERAFKASHDRAPTKDDIRLQPSIAAKYKEYNKLRAAAAKPADKPSSSRSSAVSKPPPHSTTTAAAESSHIFKTPTKLKSSRSRPRPDAVSSSTDGPTPAVDASPSKRLSSSRDKPSSSSTTSFVHANSPSKLRALAAAHSTSGSPNRPTSGAWASATLAPSDSLPVTGVSASPQKRARNPFASPQKGTFGELERAERERLKAKKRAERERARASGVLGGKATSRGAGWGGASSVPDGGAARAFARTESVGSARGMDLDEVDDFFSSQASTHAPSQSQGSQRLLAQLAKASPVRPVVAAAPTDDDEVFGPSPVKRPSASNPLFGLSPSSSTTAAPAPKRIFKPLVPDSPPPSRPVASAAPTAAPAKPKPFSSSLPSSFLPPAPAASRKRVPAPGDGDDDRDAADAALDDYDDDFYADALDEAEAATGGGAKGKGRATKGAAATRGKGRAAAAPAKRKKVAAGAAAGAGAKKAGGRAKGKGKAAADDDGGSSEDGAEMDVEEENDPEVRIVSSSRARGELVLDVSRDPALGLGPGRERLVIHEKGFEARVKALEREERRRRAEERAREAGEGREGDEAAPLDVRTTASDGERDDDDVGDEASLFHRRAGLDLLSRLRADAACASAASTVSTAADDTDDADLDALGASLPADLAAVLSLRASPQKTHSAALAKQRQVARLLGEPGTGGSRRRQKGLLGLDEGDVDEGDGEGAGEEVGEGDDDWDEEPDGWKATADAMDGYYSADGW
ncbi:hypothetical protein JCM3775_003467 [Rhodotorula graminis]